VPDPGGVVRGEFCGSRVWVWPWISGVELNISY
jgi:hypothetical protein